MASVVLIVVALFGGCSDDEPSPPEAPVISAPRYSGRVSALLADDERLRVLSDDVKACVGDGLEIDSALLERPADRNALVAVCERTTEVTASVLGDAVGSVTAAQRECVRSALARYKPDELEQLRDRPPGEIVDESLRRRVQELVVVCAVPADGTPGGPAG